MKSEEADYSNKIEFEKKPGTLVCYRTVLKIP